MTFFLSHVIPGDPARLYSGFEAREDVVQIMRVELGLDQPVHIQYMKYISDLLRGDLGESIFFRRPVSTILIEVFPATLELTVGAVLLAVVVGIPLGVISASKRNKPFDHVTRIISILGVSVPLFWLGLILLLTFQVTFPIIQGVGRIEPIIGSNFPITTITGFYSIDAFVTGNWSALFSSLSHIVLPAFTLSFIVLARLVRIGRSSMVEVLQKEFIVVAKAKGLPQRVILYRHALKNSLIPTVTVLGVSFGRMLGGSILVETIFQWPGMGLFAYQAITNNDFPAVMGAVLLMTLMALAVNLVVDLIYVMLDPRIRYG